MNIKEHEKYKNFYYIPFIDEYLINKNGDIFSIKRNKLIKKHIETSTGNLRVVLRINEKQITYFAARLVAQVFLPKILGKPLVGYKDNNSNNIKLNNLYWTSTDEQQKIFWENKQKQNLKYFPLPLITKENNGIYPNAIKCIIKPGFYYIPFENTHVVLNKQGCLFNLLTDKEHPVRFSKKGYLVTSLGISPNYKTYQVHRLIALLFIEKPSRHLDKTFNELQVNHIDGNKRNNSLDNLEWVTNEENMEHARKLELFSKSKPVLTRNINTNEINRYKSISECSRFFKIHNSKLFTHLNSNSFGRIIKNNNVFKYDDNTEWPKELSIENYNKNFTTTCDYVAKNILTNRIIIGNSIKYICEDIGLKLSHVQCFRTRYGNNSIYKNWVFMRLDQHLIESKNNGAL